MKNTKSLMIDLKILRRSTLLSMPSGKPSNLEGTREQPWRTWDKVKKSGMEGAREGGREGRKEGGTEGRREGGREGEGERLEGRRKRE
jgi:hypothetical protein